MSNSPAASSRSRFSPWSDAPSVFTLPAGETHVLAFPLELAESRLSELERLLSRHELARADRFRQARDRRRYIVARAQLRRILGCCLGREPLELQFHYGSHGKPALMGGSDHERVRFNSARSHELGVVAVQLDHDVGVDLEHVRPFPDALDIANRFFAPNEYAVLSSLPAAELDAAFFSYWTRKEAIVKSVGLGLSHPIGAFALAPAPGAGVEQVVIAGAGAAVRWSLPVPPPAAGYVAAVATAGGPRPLRCWAWGDPQAPPAQRVFTGS